MMGETEKLPERFKAGEHRVRGKLLERKRNFLRPFVDLRLDSYLRARVDPSDVVQETPMVAGERIHEFVERYPAIASDIRCVLPALAQVTPSVEGSPNAASLNPGIVGGEFGDFRVLREIGRGGMGVVYQA